MQILKRELMVTTEELLLFDIRQELIKLNACLGGKSQAEHKEKKIRKSKKEVIDNARDV